MGARRLPSTGESRPRETIMGVYAYHDIARKYRTLIVWHPTVHLSPIYGEKKQNALGQFLHDAIAHYGDIY
jgi:hypothetical protein